MIKLNVENKIIRNSSGELILNEDILFFINDDFKVINGSLSIKDFILILNRYDALFLVYKNLSRLKFDTENLILRNEIDPVMGSLNIFEVYKIKPIIDGKNYFNSVTPYSNIEKDHSLFFINRNGDKKEIEEIKLKHFLLLPILFKNKMMCFKDMFNNSILTLDVNINISLNDFILFLLSVKRI